MSKDKMDLLPGVMERFDNFDAAHPSAGEVFPAIELKSLSGKSVKLPTPGKPLLLVTGSASCPVYRGRDMKLLDDWRRKLADRLDVFVLYTTEAHPAVGPSLYVHGQWILEPNYEQEVFVEQAKSYADRVATAAALAERFALDTNSLLIDRIDNHYWEMLGGLPNLAILVGSDGEVVYKENWATQTLTDDGSERMRLEAEVRQLLEENRD
jgi:hypothetical protein